MTELTSNARFIQGINILTAKIQDPVALEALVKAMEICLGGKEYGSGGVDGSGLVEAPVKPEEAKHPLEDYKITEKDVGSIVLLGDDREEMFPQYLDEVSDLDYWVYAEPYLDTIALHFKPFYATPNSVAPDDLGEHYAVLWSDGRIEVLTTTEMYDDTWTRNDHANFWAIGYRPLKFVNPLEEV